MMSDNSQSIAKELGQALSELYLWNNSSDVEALQTLLCIQLLADHRGYAQLAEVRREVGIAPDRMTRCVRLLMGQKKSMRLSLLAGDTNDRAPLIDMAAYEDSPTVKRVALTPKGRDIVHQFLLPSLKRQERIAELEEKVKVHARIIQAVEDLGYDTDKLASGALGGNDVFAHRAKHFLGSLLKDLANLSPQKIYDLGLPNTQQCLMTLAGFSPGSEASEDEARRQLGFLYAIINHARTTEDSR